MERPRLTLQQRREVRRLRGKGLKLWEVAAAIGCSRQTVTRVLFGPGKLESRQFEWTPGPSHLSLAEREEISLGLRSGETIRTIAGRLGRAASTISREVTGNGDLELSGEDASLLAGMSAATIDRALKPAREATGLRGRSHTKPVTLLKSQISIRTWADWDENRPGCIEIDLVGHEGGNSSGEFCFTLTATDIATGWTVNRSVKNKAAVWGIRSARTCPYEVPVSHLGH